MLGPRQFGRTTFFGLSKLGYAARPRAYDPSRTIQPGTVALLDTEKETLEFVTRDWLPDVSQRCEEIVEQLASCLY